MPLLYLWFFQQQEGFSKETTIACRRLDELFATKRGTGYRTTLAWMRRTLSFALLRSAISCIAFLMSLNVRSRYGLWTSSPISVGTFLEWAQAH